MASKFEKEEQIGYSDCNNDSSEAESDNEYNNSKSSNSSGRSSPDGNFDVRILNDTRSGGPCSPDGNTCYACSFGWWYTPCRLVTFTCGHSIYLCTYCKPRKHRNCPHHPRSPRKK